MTTYIWLKQRVRRQLLNIRVMELLRFEELLRTYVFIGSRRPFRSNLLTFAHNLFGKSFGFRRAIRNHVLRALHRVLVIVFVPPFVRRVSTLSMLTFYGAALRVFLGVVVDVQGLLVFRAAVVLGNGVS